MPPLARATDWVDVELDLGDGPRRYRRETNTMPQWAGSCWYYLRYLDPVDDDALVDPEIERYWMRSGGVDLYVGGVEHAVLHLLYARFWHKVLFDLGYVGTPEPFARLFNQGYVQAAAYTDERGFYVEAAEVERYGDRWFHEGRPVTRSYGKMGKSLKNGVAPGRGHRRLRRGHAAAVRAVPRAARPGPPVGHAGDRRDRALPAAGLALGRRRGDRGARRGRRAAVAGARARAAPHGGRGRAATSSACTSTPRSAR